MLRHFLLYRKVNQLDTYIPFLLNLPPSTPISPLQVISTEMSSLCYTAASRLLSVLHMAVCICQS